MELAVNYFIIHAFSGTSCGLLKNQKLILIALRWTFVLGIGRRPIALKEKTFYAKFLSVRYSAILL